MPLKQQVSVESISGAREPRPSDFSGAYTQAAGAEECSGRNRDKVPWCDYGDCGSAVHGEHGM